MSITPAERVRRYLARHSKNRQGDPRAIHGYDLGEPSEAELLVADLQALAALTPRHEAPAELLSNPQELEAPAEGAGEFARQMEILRKAASVPVPDDDNDFTVEKARRGSESWRVIAANVLREYDRARSSAPEASK